MRNALLGAMSMAVLAATAQAQLILPGHEAGAYVIRLDGTIVPPGGPGAPRVVSENYDNWRAASSTPPGVSALLGLYASNGNEIADDLNMVGLSGAGLLSSMGLSVANMQPAGGGTLVTGSGTIRFYRQSDTGFIGGFNFNLPTLNAAPGASFRLSFAPGSLEPLSIMFSTPNIYASIQYTAATYTGPGGVTDVGIQLRGPLNTGTSSDNLYNVPGFTSFNFGGNPPANTALFIMTNSVPAPGALALLGLGGLFAARRRR